LWKIIGNLILRTTLVYIYGDMVLQVARVSNETGKHGHESRWTRNRELLGWWGPAAIVNDPFSRQRGRISINPQLSNSNYNLVMGSIWVPDTRTAWPTVSQSITSASIDLLIKSGESYSYEMLEAGRWSQEQFGNIEEGKRPPFRAATKQRLLKT
jgi:hypothetical protein